MSAWGDFECVQLVSSPSGLKLLPSWPSHCIHHCFPIHPSLLSPQLLPTANLVINVQIYSISRRSNVDCCIRCTQWCFMKSDLQNKVGRKILEERPPYKKEDGAAAGCRGGWAPTKGSSSRKSSRGFADGSERWSGARAAGGARGRRKRKRSIALARFSTISMHNCRIGLQLKTNRWRIERHQQAALWRFERFNNSSNDGTRPWTHKDMTINLCWEGNQRF